MLINWFHKKAYIEPDLKLYMNPNSKCKGVRHDDPQGVIFGGKKYFLCVNYAEICVNGNAAFTQGCFVPSLIEIGPVVLEKKIFKFHQCIFTFS